MKKFLATILTIIMSFSSMGITTVFADGDYTTINQYIHGYYKEIYNETNIEKFDKVILQNMTENGVWLLSTSVYANGLFDEHITKVNELYAVNTQERYYFTFTSETENILYLCITGKGEMFFGRIADYNKVNYCEYILDEPDTFLNRIRELCQTENPGFISWNTETDKTSTFSDVSGHWAEKQIERIADDGIISGYPDGTFKPDAPVTRAEFAKIATLAFNLEPSNTKQYYADIDGGEWFYTYAQAIGFMPNYLLPDKEHPNMKPYIYDGHNANFLPNENAVRMHIAEVLSGIYVNIAPVSYSNDIHKLTQEVLATFNDDCYKNLSLASENADKMIKFTWIANNLGIMQGDDNGNFNPYGYVTRAELVTMIDRMLSATDNSNLLKYNKTINLNPNSSTQLEELIVENGYGYWTFDINNNSESPVKILITKDTPTGEQIGDLVRAWQKENKTIDCGGIPLADGVYYLSITTNGEHYFDGSIDISLSNQAN